jgi:hypothetical protein
MATDPRLFLPSVVHFRKHPDSLAERLAREAIDDVVRRLRQLAQRPEEEDEGPDWLDLDENSNDEEIGAAYRNTFERDERRPEPVALRTPRVIRVCPLDVRWRRWDMFGDYADDFRLIAPEDRGRCAAARSVRPVRHLGVVTLQWEVAADDARPKRSTEAHPPAGKSPDGSPRHLHTETVLAGRVVHIDMVDVRKGGPGRSVREFRVFVDGTLCGRGGQCGCSLGFGGDDLPAVARVSADRALTVDSVTGRDAPIVELWEVRPQESR